MSDEEQTQEQETQAPETEAVDTSSQETDTSTAETETPEVENVLSMSDEDVNNMVESPPKPAKSEASGEETQNEDNGSQEAESASTDAPTASKETKEAKLDYEAEYNKLIAPFRANGKEMNITNVDDAITLMQQGANYSKKMAGLKPNLKLMKMLDKNGLLDEQKLSYLIDLEQKNPAAIQKFIKESGIDPLDIDTEADTEYTPNAYTVDDKEVEIDEILENIRDTESFDKTIDVISNKWDASSKKLILEQPALIEVINGHIGSGIYDQISYVVEHERMLGKLNGVSDLEAYKQVGDAIQAVDGFNKQTPNTPNVAQETAGNTPDDPKLKDRKRAAGSTKQSASKSVSKDFNPLGLSDAEFDKIAGTYS